MDQSGTAHADDELSTTFAWDDSLRYGRHIHDTDLYTVADWSGTLVLVLVKQQCLAFARCVPSNNVSIVRL